MSDSIDYGSIPIPDGKSPTEYTYTERRAEILSLIEEAGHPDNLNQTRLAERYGTSQSNISKDFKRLREHYHQTLGRHRVAIAETVYRKSIREYVDRGDYKKAVDVLESWNDWLREEGARSAEPDVQRLEGEMNLNHAGVVAADLQVPGHLVDAIVSASEANLEGGEAEP